MTTILSYLIDRALDTLDRTSPENRAKVRVLAEQRRPPEGHHPSTTPHPNAWLVPHAAAVVTLPKAR